MSSCLKFIYKMSWAHIETTPCEMPHLRFSCFVCMSESKNEHEYGGRYFCWCKNISYMKFRLSDKVKNIQLAGIYWIVHIRWATSRIRSLMLCSLLMQFNTFTYIIQTMFLLIIWIKHNGDKRTHSCISLFKYLNYRAGTCNLPNQSFFFQSINIHISDTANELLQTNVILLVFNVSIAFQLNNICKHISIYKSNSVAKNIDGLPKQNWDSHNKIKSLKTD